MIKEPLNLIVMNRDWDNSLRITFMDDIEIKAGNVIKIIYDNYGRVDAEIIRNAEERKTNGEEG